MNLVSQRTSKGLALAYEQSQPPVYMGALVRKAVCSEARVSHQFQADRAEKSFVFFRHTAKALKLHEMRQHAVTRIIELPQGRHHLLLVIDKVNAKHKIQLSLQLLDLRSGVPQFFVGHVPLLGHSQALPLLSCELLFCNNQRRSCI